MHHDLKDAKWCNFGVCGVRLMSVIKWLPSNLHREHKMCN